MISDFDFNYSLLVLSAHHKLPIENDPSKKKAPMLGLENFSYHEVIFSLASSHTWCQKCLNVYFKPSLIKWNVIPALSWFDPDGQS